MLWGFGCNPESAEPDANAPEQDADGGSNEQTDGGSGANAGDGGLGTDGGLQQGNADGGADGGANNLPADCDERFDVWEAAIDAALEDASTKACTTDADCGWTQIGCCNVQDKIFNIETVRELNALEPHECYGCSVDDICVEPEAPPPECVEGACVHNRD